MPRSRAEVRGRERTGREDPTPNLDVKVHLQSVGTAGFDALPAASGLGQAKPGERRRGAYLQIDAETVRQVVLHPTQRIVSR